MQQGLQELKKLAIAINPEVEHDWEKFSMLWKPFSAKRKEILTVAGEKEKYL
jgi:hypothetical protein